MRSGSALGVALVVSLAIAAADKPQPPTAGPLNIKVGLWQMTYSTERNGVAVVHTIPPELLAKMTPDQRARTEARLRARAAQGSQIETRHYCLTEERLKNAIFEVEESQNQSCQRTILASNAKLQQFHEECSEIGGKRSAEGRFEALDFDTLKGLLKVKGEGSNPFTLNVEIAGKWIGDDCGDTAQ